MNKSIESMLPIPTKTFAQMSYVEFIEKYLEIELKQYQKDMIKLFEENKGREIMSLMNTPTYRINTPNIEDIRWK